MTSSIRKAFGFRVHKTAFSIVKDLGGKEYIFCDLYMDHFTKFDIETIETNHFTFNRVQPDVYKNKDNKFCWCLKVTISKETNN